METQIDNNTIYKNDGDYSQMEFTFMLLPGIGNVDMNKSLWYPWLKNELQKKFPKAELIFKEMPDPVEAREKYWIPFTLKQIQPSIEKNKKIFIIGHSSGAVALMRLIEKTKITGAFLVAGYVSDLGDEIELRSGYFPKQPNSDKLRPWLWEDMKNNTDFIINIGAEDDKFVPFYEIKEISNCLKLEDGISHFQFKKELGLSHFLIKSFPQLLEIVVNKIHDSLSKYNLNAYSYKL